MQLSFAQRKYAEKLTVIHYFTSVDASNGKPTYYYMAIEGIKMPAFKQALAKGNFDPEDYGKVLDWGYGEPSEEVKARYRVE